ncbi:MAG: DEAD/DEAH box helicase [Bacteroidales bacterium]|nr:DEAD/DEAH box helicase [Bacteroidales bacterium]
MLAFELLGVSSHLLQGIKALGFEKPTPIQEKVIPVVFNSNKDIIGLAQTGTGKTAAFGLPLIAQIDTNNHTAQVLILSPTRELCIQISNDLQNFSKYMDTVKIVPVYGGAAIDNQIKAIKKGVQIIVATPGRMLDLIKRRAANITNISTVVLDEADEMLNMGFREDLNSILEQTPDNKRTLLFSATMSKEVAAIAKNYLVDPVKITIGTQNAGAENIKHVYYQVHARNRYPALKRIADFNTDIYGIVFCRTRIETKEVADKLIKDGYNADALHGDLSQAQRDHVMKRFREKTLQILVATDVAARGIDVSDITHVINYNLPEELDIYTHRTGRTGRAEKSGVAISIVNYREVTKIPFIEKIINKKMVRLPVPNGTEICKKQLFKFIDKMENASVDEEKIAPFMESVNEKLAWLSKEQIIKHFLSLEFNRFLEYYKNAPDLNERSVEPRGQRDRRTFVSDNNGSGLRKGKSNGKYARFFINVGRKDGVDPKRIIGIINEYADDRDINIGEIEMKDSFSFFEVGEKHAVKIVKSFRNANYQGRTMVVEPAEVKSAKRQKKRYGNN